ncbi:MAG: (2E,6E)-farnesyl diphosphate synthase [Rheinheimera sp.]
MESVLAFYQSRVEQVMVAALAAQTVTDPELLAAMQYSLLSGGKRVRPFLVYAVGQMLGASLDDLDAPAAAIECLHSYSLIHDDLPAMDDDDLRRGRPTCHKAFSEATAILAGDALQALSFELLSSHNYQQVPYPKRLQMVQQLARQAGNSGMCGGQAIDLAHTNKQMTVAALEAMHQLKTGALIECAVQMAWLASPATAATELQALVRYARALGLAFQVQDDILDIEGDTATLGKPQGSDQQANKATYPSLLGLPAAKAKAQQLFAEAKQALTVLPYDTQPLSAFAHYVIARSF